MVFPFFIGSLMCKHLYSFLLFQYLFFVYVEMKLTIFLLDRTNGGTVLFSLSNFLSVR